MTIDPEVAKLFGLNSGGLLQQQEKDQNWDRRLMKEVLEPFDQILKEQSQDTQARMNRGLTPELVRDVQRFNNSVGHHLAMMLVLFVVSNIRPQADQDGSLTEVAIRLLAMRNGLEAEKLFRAAKGIGKKKEGE